MVTVQVATEGQLRALIPLYKGAFTRHHKFEKSPDEIFMYLSSVHEKNRDLGGFYVALDHDQVVGGILVRKVHDDVPGRHITVRYNHLAVKDSRQGIGSALVTHVDQVLEAKVRSGEYTSIKIEATVAEGEKQSLAFYEKMGFKKEGTHPSHYRLGETAYSIGKLLQ